MTIALTKDQINSLLSHAEQEYPNECVGAVIGDGTPGGNEVIRLTNSQNSFHEKDPARFGRDARTGYFVDPREVMALSRRTEKEGKKILAFYHSHPEHECYFSQEDHAAAVMWGEPVYPDAVYIIISVFGGKVKDSVIFSWDGSTYSPSGGLETG